MMKTAKRGHRTPIKKIVPKMGHMPSLDIKLCFAGQTFRFAFFFKSQSLKSEVTLITRLKALPYFLL